MTISFLVLMGLAYCWIPHRTRTVLFTTTAWTTIHYTIQSEWILLRWSKWTSWLNMAVIFVFWLFIVILASGTLRPLQEAPTNHVHL